MTWDYKLVTRHGHPNAKARGQIYEHILVMSEMLGRPLTKEEIVHHHDEDKRNNAPSNLQLFATKAEHNMQHAKMDALRISGNADFMKRPFCKTYDDPSKMYMRKTQYQAWHRKCKNAYVTQQSIGI
jgi:LAS superfamily LD-carboxypeptidase LdcB